MKVIEAIVDIGHVDTIVGIAQQNQVDYWFGAPTEDGRQSVRLLVSVGNRQKVLDALQNVLEASEKSRIVVIPTESALLLPEYMNTETENGGAASSISREEIYNIVEKGARLNSNYFLLVVLSTIVAAIGLIENNVAVIIGAMVIAPLLGPNISFALAGALGDTRLLVRSLQSNLSGLLLASVLSIAIGFWWAFDINQPEIMSRTHIGLDGIALALASGAAAVLSLTSGLSSILVGVMVAVALLPPTATMGMMLGRGEFSHAYGAGLVVLANVVCVNLSAKTVFLVKGIKPRKWYEKKKAKQSSVLSLVLWIVLLTLVITLIVINPGRS